MNGQVDCILVRFKNRSTAFIIYRNSRRVSGVALLSIWFGIGGSKFGYGTGFLSTQKE